MTKQSDDGKIGLSVEMQRWRAVDDRLWKNWNVWERGKFCRYVFAQSRKLQREKTARGVKAPDRKDQSHALSVSAQLFKSRRHSCGIF
jgi:hypothetical protein